MAWIQRLIWSTADLPVMTLLTQTLCRAPYPV